MDKNIHLSGEAPAFRLAASAGGVRVGCGLTRQNKTINDD